MENRKEKTRKNENIFKRVLCNCLLPTCELDPLTQCGILQNTLLYFNWQKPASHLAQRALTRIYLYFVPISPKGAGKTLGNEVLDEQVGNYIL